MLDPLDTEVDAAHSCDVEMMDQRFAEITCVTFVKGPNVCKGSCKLK